MAGLTKEQRAEREAAERERMRKEIEEQVRSEMSSSTNVSNNDLLKKENEDLKSQLAEMMNMIKDLQTQKTESEKTSAENVNIDTSENIEDV